MELATVKCEGCGQMVTHGEWPFCPHGSAYGVKSGEWGESDKIVVFRKSNGELSYPMTNAKATPPGAEKIEIRSMAALRRFEKANNVASHMGNYDRNGRGMDDRFRGETL